MSLTFEMTMLWAVVAIALGALIYAILLAREILGEVTGTGKMLQVWRGISEGANAYLKKQLRSIFFVIAILAVVLYISSILAGGAWSISVGRALAFLMGVTFSRTCGISRDEHGS